MHRFSKSLGSAMALAVGLASAPVLAQGIGDPATDLFGPPVSRLSFGLGWDPDRSAVAKLRFATRHFLREGVQAELAAEASGTDHSISFSVSSDRLTGQNPSLGFNIYSGAQNAPSSFAFSRNDAGAELFLRFAALGPGALDLYYAYRSTEISGVAATSSILLQDDVGTRRSHAVGYRFALPFGNSDSFGGRFTLGQEAASVSDNGRPIRSRIGLNLHSAPERPAVFSMALAAGLLVSQVGDSRVEERFFLGGDNIRGFALGGIGPRDRAVAGNEALGGNQFATARFDVQFPGLLPGAPNFKPGIFGDIGSLWGLDDTNGGVAGGSPVDASQLIRASAGISIAWSTDAGDLRLTVAQPIQKQTYDQTQLVQFSFNTSF